MIIFNFLKITSHCLWFSFFLNFLKLCWILTSFFLVYFFYFLGSSYILNILPETNCEYICKNIFHQLFKRAYCYLLFFCIIICTYHFFEDVLGYNLILPFLILNKNFYSFHWYNFKISDRGKLVTILKLLEVKASLPIFWKRFYF